jgi:predicted RNA-binding protein with PUA-like domain
MPEYFDSKTVQKTAQWALVAIRADRVSSQNEIKTDT